MSSRWSLFAVGLVALTGCKSESPPPEAPATPSLVSYALGYPGELARTTSAYDEGRGEALQRCGEAMELASSIKDPVDAEVWAALVAAAEKSGKSGLYAGRARDNAAFQRMLRERDDEIAKRTAGTAQYTAEQKGCGGAAVDVGSAAASGLRRSAEKRLEDRLHDVNEAHDILQQRRDAIGKPNLAPLGRQADAIAYATYLTEVALPRLAYERVTLSAASSKVRQTLESAISSEEEARGGEANAKASEERLRALKAALSELATLEPKLVTVPEKLQDELRDTRDGCEEILSALRKDMKKRAK
ncbi:MAG: hypothetical protein FJ095_09930 [Deltaproteobacteria bacterium]|nr:hypothetical protein [Deltaproteobacteria bacterium]